MSASRDIASSTHNVLQQLCNSFKATRSCLSELFIILPHFTLSSLCHFAPALLFILKASNGWCISLGVVSTGVLVVPNGL
jgi:hypothetical protein